MNEKDVIKTVLIQFRGGIKQESVYERDLDNFRANMWDRDNRFVELYDVNGRVHGFNKDNVVYYLVYEEELKKDD